MRFFTFNDWKTLLGTNPQKAGHTFNVSTLEAEAGGFLVRGQYSLVYSEFQDSQSYAALDPVSETKPTGHTHL